MVTLNRSKFLNDYRRDTMFKYNYSFFVILGHVGGCGITDEVVQWMERIQNSGVDDEPQTSPAPAPTPSAPPPSNHHAPASQPPHPNSLRDDEPR